METASSPSSTGRGSASPPPKCAICLGSCNNKCCSDSCRHHFCFTCLLQWSKVKPECPLCKQPFKSIIHNIKSNNDYEEHFVTRNEEPRPAPMEEYLYLPTAPSRHYQFRTTFTVDPGGELAIQQMLETHPLTNNTLYGVPGNYMMPHHRRGRHPRFSQIGFRSSIYEENLWVYAPPDITGRCRDTSPQFYRENEAARHRLVPWLNRELSALMHGNTLSVMYLVDIIMEHLQRWNIRSREFKNLLMPFLHEKTSHFIHEFYNFMRSPYDMIGYDRHVIYSSLPHSPTAYVVSDTDTAAPTSDADVSLVGGASGSGGGGPFFASIPMPFMHNNPFRGPPTLEVIEINSDSSRDSDVIIREPTPPEIVDLLDSDTNDEEETAGAVAAAAAAPSPPGIAEGAIGERARKPILPIKIRFKCKRQTRERRRGRCRIVNASSSSSSSSTSSSSSSSTSSTSSSDDSDDSSARRRKHKYRMRGKYARAHKRAHKNRTATNIVVGSSSSSSSSNSSSSPTVAGGSRENAHAHTTRTECASSGSEAAHALKRRRPVKFDSDDNLPLSKIFKRELQKRERNGVETQVAAAPSSGAVPKQCATTTSSSSSCAASMRPSCSSWRWDALPATSTPPTPMAMDRVFGAAHAYYPPVGAYDLTRRSYTPPPYAYGHLQQQQHQPPPPPLLMESVVRVNASTSPMNLSTPSCSSAGQRMRAAAARRQHSVIVKKEEAAATLTAANTSIYSDDGSF